jgi:V/A-type H+/Na+-transporting ATPase subunit I
LFRTVPMMKLQAIVLTHDERAVLKDLGRLGAVHLMRIQPGPDTAPLSPIDYSREMVQYDRIRARIQGLRKLMETTPLPNKSWSGAAPATMTAARAMGKLSSMEQEVGNLLEHQLHLVQRQKELSAICEQVLRYRGLEIPLTGFDQFSFLHFVTGSLPEQNYEDLRTKVGDNVAFLPLIKQKGRQSIFAIASRQGYPVLEKALQQAGFQQEVLPVVEGATTDKLFEEKEREQEQLASELGQLNNKLKTIAAGFALPLDEIERFIDTECRLIDASQKFPRTEATSLITGWIPAFDVAVLEQSIGEITAGRCIIQTALPDASMQESPPVLLRHPRLLRPFEMLVSAYGLPDYQELEPTLFVALSYIVMFGMMFGDAGHGIVLAVCGLIALFAVRSPKTKDIGIILLFGGLSSTIFGMVYGSYFGIEVFKKYALWHDPLEGDPVQLMYGAIGIGIVLISIGLILNVVNRFRQGDVIGGILDKFGLVGILFYWGSLALLMYGQTIRSLGFMSISIILFLVVPIIGWSLKEPLEHLMSHGKDKPHETDDGLAGAIIESCVGAFEAILSYLANTISFVRLAAYAMSHAALLFAAFMLAAEVRNFPVGGGLFSLCVIIAGNLIAIVLEGIIASVQALRLEYYEFFGKFFAGSGRPFEPFRLAQEVKNSMSREGGL